MVSTVDWTSMGDPTTSRNHWSETGRDGHTHDSETLVPGRDPGGTRPVRGPTPVHSLGTRPRHRDEERSGERSPPSTTTRGGRGSCREETDEGLRVSCRGQTSLSSHTSPSLTPEPVHDPPWGSPKRKVHTPTSKITQEVCQDRDLPFSLS